MGVFKMAATAAFGVEGLVKKELERLECRVDAVENGRITFFGDERSLCRANLWLRQAERVLVEMGRFKALSFDDLFEGTKALPWEDWLPEDACFPVEGKSIRSVLFSVPDCQAIVKKAVVERLKQRYKKVDWFRETGARYRIEVALLKDEAILTIDTSGAGLHKRGYRSLSAPAPLRETLASVMLTLSNWRPQYPLVDPCCGSGTILIEAVMKALNLAPGLRRSFAAQEWPRISPSLWDSVREEARDLACSLPELRVEGYDLDPEVLSLARYHARQAGAEAHIHFQRRALSHFKSAKKYGSIISNPVYGRRMEDHEAARALYLDMGKVFQGLDTWSVYILTSHPDFEVLYGRKASKTRKLYNGRIECRLYQYHGPRPKKPETQKGEEQNH